MLVLDVLLDVRDELVVRFASNGLTARTVDLLGHVLSFRVGTESTPLDPGFDRVGPDDDGVRDLHDLVCRQTCPRGVLADLLRARSLVDAHRPESSALLLHHVAANPADVARHLLVADLARALGRFLELLRRAPAAAPSNHVKIHVKPPSWPKWSHLDVVADQNLPAQAAETSTPSL